MSKFIALTKIDGHGYDEDAGALTETSKPCLVNVDAIRCMYARRDGKPGTRITFTDGGGFAVSETPDVIGGMIAGGDLILTLAAPASNASN